MIIFVGDICLADNDFDVGYGVGSKIMRGLKPFLNITKKEGDIWFGNLECVLAEHTRREGYNKDCFRSKPSSLAVDSIIDCYSVANNHIMEHGNEAYKETIDAICSHGKNYVGSKEKKTIILEDGERTIAVSCFSLRCDNTGYDADYWYAPEMKEIKGECEKYSSANTRVAYIHWGVEFMPYPYSEQQKLAHYLVDIGYDLIIGVHPHVLQGCEIYKGKYIFYSLGNFVFNMAYQDTNFGLIVYFDTNTGIIATDYTRIGSNYCPAIIQESEVPERLRLGSLNAEIGKYPNVEQYCRVSDTYLKKYRKCHHKSILRNAFNYSPMFLKGMIMNFIYDRKK